MKLIIPMAGRGTRVRPHSHVTPKPLLNVRGKSIVERIVTTFARVLPRTPDEGVFVLGPDFGAEIREQLSDICNRHGFEANFAVQETAEGTAHAVYQAGDYLEGEGIIVFADTIFDMEGGVDLEDKDVVIWVKHVEDPSRFGVAVREEGRVVQLVEKPSEPISNEAIIGIYYIKDLARLRKAIAHLIEEDVRGHGDELQLTDALDMLLQEGAFFDTASVSEWLDCGTIPSLLDTTRHILEKENGSEEREGSVENSIIHEPVFLGPGAEVIDSVVGPHVSVEAGATIRGSVVRESILFTEAKVEEAVLSRSLIGRHATVHETPRSLNVGDHSELGPRS